MPVVVVMVVVPTLSSPVIARHAAGDCSADGRSNGATNGTVGWQAVWTGHRSMDRWRQRWIALDSTWDSLAI